jgi:hypothetical protein
LVELPPLWMAIHAATTKPLPPTATCVSASITLAGEVEMMPAGEPLLELLEVVDELLDVVVLVLDVVVLDVVELLDVVVPLPPAPPPEPPEPELVPISVLLLPQPAHAAALAARAKSTRARFGARMGAAIEPRARCPCHAERRAIAPKDSGAGKGR